MMKSSKKSGVLKAAMEYTMSIGLFMVIWQVYVMVADVPTFVLPSPVDVIKSFIEMFTSGMIFPHLGITMVEVVIGFFLGSLLGMILGIESMPKDAKNLMTVLGGSRWQLFSKIEMPYALPALFSSFKIGIVQAVIGAIVAEWMSAKQGLGYILTYASSTYDTPMLMAGILTTILLGIVTYEIVYVLDSKLLYWHESKNQ